MNLAPGILELYFLEAVVLTVPVSLILLLWYRRSIARRMRTPSDLRIGARDPSAGEMPQELGAVSALVDSDASHEQDGDAGRVQARSVRLRLIVVYGLAGMAAAVVMTLLYFRSPGLEASALRVFAVLYALCWAIVPTLAALLVIPQRKALLAFAGYVGIGAAIVLLWSVFSRFVLAHTDVSPWGNVQSYLAFLLMQAWLPYLFILITGNRRLRSVSSLVLAGLLVFSFSAWAVLRAFAAMLDYPAIRETLLRLGVNSYYLLYMLAALPVGYACWQGLRWLGKYFGQKAFSDVQLLVDTWWLIVAFDYVASISTDLGWGGLLGVLAFLAYRLVVALGLALWRVPASPNKRHALLLLRVFGFQRRTEQLFDAIAQRWRLRGAVAMIAGSDLAMRTIDPSDFIPFLGGRLRQLFVQDNRDLSQRLVRLDEARDPDGRYRINEFLCYDDTWRPTVRSLLTHSELVLMDLRGFSESNSGCLFELRQLVECGRLHRTILVIDDQTDVPLLESTLTEHARRIGALDKNESLPRLNLSSSEARSAEDLNTIYGSLCALAPA